jgi:hypothetical protein
LDLTDDEPLLLITKLTSLRLPVANGINVYVTLWLLAMAGEDRALIAASTSLSPSLSRASASVAFGGSAWGGSMICEASEIRRSALVTFAAMRPSINLIGTYNT